ncbi:ABC transporter ATP-binding protein [Erysipelothrix aquatica]|uniref:ABC transporter ATP-binding protein n=1 Tax=Erysipelothrix aquatica TaxID=2683714 RepID=UPI00135A1F29|nr:ABC transporter ATP-binding protein [Erysipelothrix aquatica]
MKKKSMLTGENLSYQYKESKSKVVKNVDIAVYKGKFTAIVGPNGCGKTTLFKLLMGELKTDEGIVKFENENILNIKPKERAKKIAIVHQRNQAIEGFTVKEVVAMGRIPYQGIFKSCTERDEIIQNNALSLVGLEDLANKYCTQLSGGQLQRVWLALALAQEPDLILLDEPTTYLDIKYQIQLMEMIRELVDNHGITCLAVLHDLNLLINYVDYVYLMKEGKFEDSGPTDKIINSKNLQSLFGVKGNVLKSIGGRKVIDLYLSKEDEYVHKDVKFGAVL